MNLKTVFTFAFSKFDRYSISLVGQFLYASKLSSESLLKQCKNGTISSHKNVNNQCYFFNDVKQHWYVFKLV